MPMSWILVSLSRKSLCVRVVFFLSLLLFVVAVIFLSLLSRHYFLPGPTPQNPRFFH